MTTTISDIERMVITRAAAGEVADFTLETGYDAAKRPVISAAFLRRLLLGQIPDTRIAMPGVRIKGARLVGRLDLSDCAGPQGGLPALSMDFCDLPDRIDLSGARLPRLSLDGSGFRELWCVGAHIEGDFLFVNVKPLPIEGQSDMAYIRMRAVRISGDVWGRGAKLIGPTAIPDGMEYLPVALNFQGATISGLIGIDEGFVAHGEVSIQGAKIGGSLQCTAAKFINPGETALNASSCEIGGDLVLRGENPGDCQIEGTTFLSHAKIAGSLDCRGCHVKHVTSQGAFFCNGAAIGGSARFSPNTTNFIAVGGIDLSETTIEGSLDFSGASISVDRNSAALVAPGSRVGRNIFLCSTSEHRLQITGVINLEQSRIIGELNCDGANLDGVDGTSLWAYGISVGGNATLRSSGSHPFECSGDIILSGGHVGGDLDLSGARIGSQQRAGNLMVMNAEIGGDFLMSVRANRFFALDGVAQIDGSKIGRNLNCAGARIGGRNSHALAAERIDVTGNLKLCSIGERPFEARGTVRMPRSKIGGNFDCTGGKFTSQAIAIDAEAVEVGGAVHLSSNEHRFEATGLVFIRAINVKGNLNFAGAHISLPGKAALIANHMHVTGNLTFLSTETFRCEIEGSMNLIGAQISGSVGFLGAKLSDPSNIVLNAGNIEIGGDLSFLWYGDFRCEIEGTTNFTGCQVVGSASLLGAKLTGAPNGAALSAINAKIGGDLEIMMGRERPFEAVGKVDFTGAKVDREIKVHDANFKNPNRVALSLAAARIDGQLSSSNNVFAGSVSLSGAYARRLADDPETAWLGVDMIHLDEFSYSHIQTQLNTPSLWRSRAVWLRRNVGSRKVGIFNAQTGRFSNQPWRQCITAFETAGLHMDSRRLAREEMSEANRHRGRARYVLNSLTPHGLRRIQNDYASKYQAANEQALREGDLSKIFAPPAALIALNAVYLIAWPFAKLYCMMKQFFVWLFAEQAFGYGLSATRAAITTILIWITGWVGVEVAQERGALVDRTTGEVCNSIAAPLFALDAAVAVLDLDQESACKWGAAPGSKLLQGTTVSLGFTSTRTPAEIEVWRWASAIYTALGTIVLGFAVLTWTGVLQPRRRQSD